MSESLRIDIGASGTAKGRSFKAALFGIITADAFWKGASRSAHRPIYLSICGTDSTIRAMLACLRTGRPGIIETQHGTALDGGARPVEIVRSAGMRWPKPQRLQEGVVAATGYLPELCAREPSGAFSDGIAHGPDGNGGRVRFLFAPPAHWIDRQTASLQHLPAAQRRDAALGAWLAGFLDKRTPLPLVVDPRFEFARRLYLAAKAEEWWCSRSTNALRPAFWYFPVMPVGLPDVAMIDASQEEIADFIKRETGRFLREVGLERRVVGKPAAAMNEVRMPESALLPPLGETVAAWAPPAAGIYQASLFDDF